MEDVISGMTGPQLIGLVTGIGGIMAVTVITLTAIITPFLSWARRGEALVRLKRDLVAAGYSAEDIERVVKAIPDAPPSRR